MAKTKPVPPTDDESAPAGGGRKKLLIAGPLVVALVAGWFFLLGPGGGSAAEEVEAAPEPGEVLALEPITMNLSDGRLLKLGLALQLPLEPSGHGEVSGSVALDEAISFLGEHSYDQLSAPTARDTAKLELSKRVAERYHHDVLEVYFTEFVMQ